MSTLSFTEDEKALVANKAVLLSKNTILTKVADYFATIEAEISTNVTQGSLWKFPEGTLSQKGKISKGEFYQSLPYIVLDYPRYSNQQQFMFFRLLFFWGVGFQVQLHLQDPDLQHQFIAYQQAHPDVLQNTSLKVELNPALQWEHLSLNPVPYGDITALEWKEAGCIKLIHSIELEALDQIKSDYFTIFLQVFKFLEHN